MYPSWGNYGGANQQPSQHFGAPMGPSPQGEALGGGFGVYGAATPAAAPGSTFNSLREQHLQQMQQLQQLHQKQLQSVLHHDRNVNSSPYGGAGNVAATESWQGSSGYGYGSVGPGAPSSYQDEYQSMQTGLPGPQQLQQPPPLPPHSPQPKETRPQPPPPEPTPPVPSQNNGTPATKEVNKRESLALKDQANSSALEEEKPTFTSMSIQEQQQYWYKQHLQNLQRLKAEKAKQGQNQGEGPTPQPTTAGAPPPPSEPPKSTPPPPPPKEEPPPPPPPVDDTPAAQDPAEMARLQQLQSAAAQWQQAQQQRAGFQYQALMQQHGQLQTILNQYQQCIQQPAHLETMPIHMQLRHYEMQQQQFGPVFADWNHTFRLWQEQFQAYPHKDQLEDYESQWKPWQEQMNSTSAHLQVVFFFPLTVPFSGAGERRIYPEERGGGSQGGPTASHPPPPPAAPPARVEKKPETKNVEDLLKPPGRETRPERIVIIMRGLPGSGKSHVAKLIRDKEVECGGAPPRVLGLDDYFMTEVEKMEKDPDTGKRFKTKCLEYEYEPEMEDTYRNSMFKTFKKTLDDGFFPFIIIDAINDRVKYFDQFWSAAKTKGFEVYLAEITSDNQTCAKRNTHGRKLKDIQKMSSTWESSPRHMMRLDVRSLLQDAAIEEVEMEDFNPDDETPKEPRKEEEEEDVKVGPSQPVFIVVYMLR
uniref:YLP motif-containing protein 1 n=1 Tax=Esox lucius TaxID=8010 RepID=A0AAY5KZE4_ESOLU